MSFEKTEKPTELDLKNYSFDREAFKASPYYQNPGTFLKLGQRVRAKFRIWDTPGRTLEDNWGWVSAEEGETGTVVHQQDKTWPTVQFDDTGCSTCVTHMEVEPIDVDKQRAALVRFFEGLTTKLTYPNDTLAKDNLRGAAYTQGFQVAAGYLQDVESGEAPGIGLADMVQVALRELKY